MNLYDAKTHLSRLVDRAAAGEEIVIARAGRPVAVLRAWTPRAQERQLGLYAGQIRVHEDFADLPDDVAQALGLTP